MMLINQLNKLFIYLFISFLTVNCTTIHFKNSGKIDVFLGGKEGYNQQTTVSGLSEIYFYGFFPKKAHAIYIDEVLQKAGMTSAANISISEYQTAEDMLASFFSMGFYIPTRYKITAFGMGDKEPKEPGKGEEVPIDLD